MLVENRDFYTRPASDAPVKGDAVEIRHNIPYAKTEIASDAPVKGDAVEIRHNIPYAKTEMRGATRCNVFRICLAVSTEYNERNRQTDRHCTTA